MSNNSEMEQIAGLNFRGKTYQTAFMQMLNDAYEQGILSNNEDFQSYVESRQDIESELVMHYSVIAEALWDKDTGCVKLLSDNYNSHILSRAEGIDLEILAEYFGIYRVQATYSVAELELSFGSTATTTFTIPIGTRFSTAKTERYNTIYFKTQETIIVNAGDTTATVSVVSTTPSYDGRVEADEITRYVGVPDGFDALPVKINCTNPNRSYGGFPAESDDHLRDRVSNWAYSIPRTTYSSYMSYLFGVDGLQFFRLIPRWNGTGTLKVVIAPNNATTIKFIQNTIDNEIASADDDVTVVGATDEPINISIVINTDIDREVSLNAQEKAVIKTKVENAISTYISGGTLKNGEVWDGLGIGQDFIPMKCANFIADEVTELQNITFITPEHAYYYDVNGNRVVNSEGKAYALIDSEIVTVDDTEIATLGALDVTVE